MTDIGTSKLHVPIWFLILVLLLALIITFGILFFLVDDSKYESLFGGIFAGLIPCTIFYCKKIVLFKKLDEYQRMGVHHLLKNRHEKSYYRPIVGGASKRVKVMGASCSRFIDDFLDIGSDDKVLVDRLHSQPNLTVQLLVPDQENMSENTQARFNLANEKIEKLTNQFGNRFEIRRFPFEARHSFVIVDDILVAGPIFQEDRSKQAPAVHVDMSTSFGDKYLEYFQTIWGPL